MEVREWKYICGRKFKLEKQFTTWFLWLYSERGALCFKLSDADRRIKPFDAFIVYNWKSYYIEFKKTANMSCHPYRLLEWSSPKKPWWQVPWLNKVVKNGWIALVITYSTKADTYIISNFKELDFNSKISFHA